MIRKLINMLRGPFHQKIGYHITAEYQEFSKKWVVKFTHGRLYSAGFFDGLDEKTLCEEFADTIQKRDEIVARYQRNRDTIVADFEARAREHEGINIQV